MQICLGFMVLFYHGFKLQFCHLHILGSGFHFSPCNSERQGTMLQISQLHVQCFGFNCNSCNYKNPNGLGRVIKVMTVSHYWVCLYVQSKICGGKIFDLRNNLCQEEQHEPR